MTFSQIVLLPTTSLHSFIYVSLIFLQEIMNSMIKIVVTLTVLSIVFGEIFAMPPAQCSPGLLDEVPPKVRKICAALTTIYQIQSAMESYVDDKGNLYLYNPFRNVSFWYIDKEMIPNDLDNRKDMRQSTRIDS